MAISLVYVSKFTVVKTQESSFQLFDKDSNVLSQNIRTYLSKIDPKSYKILTLTKQEIKIEFSKFADGSNFEFFMNALKVSKSLKSLVLN